MVRRWAHPTWWPPWPTGSTGQGSTWLFAWLLLSHISSPFNVQLISDFAGAFSDIWGWSSSILVIFDFFLMPIWSHKLKFKKIAIFFFFFALKKTAFWLLQLCQLDLRLSSSCEIQVVWNFVVMPSIIFMNFGSLEVSQITFIIFILDLHFGLMHCV